MKFTAVGDLLIQRKFVKDYEGFQEVKEYVNKGDFKFCNLETTVHNEGECFGSQFGGGSWLRIDPENLNYLSEYGFNAVNCANNHSLDFSHKGVIKTLENLREHGYEGVGTGANLSRASAPVYIDTLQGRVALIGLVVINEQPAAMAGEQSRRVMGRPGVNGLHFERRLIVTKEQIEVVKQIADQTQVNARKNISRAEGYSAPLPENCAELDGVFFEMGDKPAQKYILNKEDMLRVEKSIYEAKLQADYIYISIHCHECGVEKNIAPDFLTEFARKCVDFGADGVIGHGPHLLRGVEVYKDRPIFYSLGDFILQNENIPFAPEDFFEKYHLNSDTTLHEVFRTRSNNFTRGLATDKRMFETIIPYWEIENGKLTKLELMPVMLTFDVPRSKYGMPQIKKDLGIVERLVSLSESFGTKIEVENGVGRVILK